MKTQQRSAATIQHIADALRVAHAKDGPALVDALAVFAADRVTVRHHPPRPYVAGQFSGAEWIAFERSVVERTGARATELKSEDKKISVVDDTIVVEEVIIGQDPEGTAFRVPSKLVLPVRDGQILGYDAYYDPNTAPAFFEQDEQLVRESLNDAAPRRGRVATIERWLDGLWPRLEPLRSLYKPYVEGLEALPADGRFLLVGNHTVAGSEALLIPYEVRRQLGVTVRPLADRNFGRMKGLSADVVTAFGAIVGTPEGTRELMRANEPILVFPGGGREIGKGKDELYTLLWGERAGFARLAVEHNYPIVAAALVGGDDVYKILTTRNGTWGRISSSLSQRINGRADMTMQLMRGVGPTLVPHPQRMYLRFSSPIETTKPKNVSTEDWVATVRDTVKANLESQLAELLRIRKADPFRQLAPWAWGRAAMPGTDRRPR